MKKTPLTYIGLRRFGNATASPAFLDNKKKTVYFTRVKYAKIGDLYEMIDDKLSVRPESKGRAKVDDDQIEKWRSEEFAAEQWARHQRGIKRANKIQMQNLDLARLSRMAEDLDWEAKHAFADRVRNFILRGKD